MPPEHVAPVHAVRTLMRSRYEDHRRAVAHGDQCAERSYPSLYRRGNRAEAWTVAACFD